MKTRPVNWILLSLIAMVTLILSACAPALAPATPCVVATLDAEKESMVGLRSTIKGQSIFIQITSQAVGCDDTLTLGQIAVLGPSWVVGYNDDGKGKPGEILRQLAVDKGLTVGQKVKIDTSKVTDYMFVILHTDAGEIGTFEFPGPDEVLLDDYRSEFLLRFRVHP